jgi:hypothetical protein
MPVKSLLKLILNIIQVSGEIIFSVKTMMNNIVLSKFLEGMCGFKNIDLILSDDPTYFIERFKNETDSRL